MLIVLVLAKQGARSIASGFCGGRLDVKYLPRPHLCRQLRGDCDRFFIELSERAAYTERTRLMGWRSASFVVGNFVGVGCIGVLQAQADREATRRAAARVCTGVGLATALLIIGAVLLLHEPPGRALATQRHPLALARVVLATEHARIYSATVVLIDGSRSAFSILAPYAVQYGLALPASNVAPLMAAYLLASLCGVPLWVALARRIGKVAAFHRAIVLFCVSHLLMLPPVHPRFVEVFTPQQRLVFACVSAFVVGFASGAKEPLGGSLAGDVIDHEQSLSGERKHGTFFAFWNLCYKSIGGLVTFLVSMLLGATHFVPNAPHQAYAVRLVIAGGFALLPMSGLVLAAVCMSHFRLGEAEHRHALSIIRQREAACVHINGGDTSPVESPAPLL